MARVTRSNSIKTTTATKTKAAAPKVKKTVQKQITKQKALQKKITSKAQQATKVSKVKTKSPSPEAPVLKKQKSIPKIVTAVKKGNGVVDSLCSMAASVHVYEEGGKTYSASLNQSNLDRNNNKFYIIQLLESDSKPSQYYTFNRWGRVGVPGQNALKGPFPLQSAKQDYEKKLRDKTKGGEYVEIEISNEEETAPKKQIKKETPNQKAQVKAKSQLDPRLQNLIGLIFDLQAIQQSMKEIGYDAKKMPLGKLADSAIKKGYDVLSELQDALTKGLGKSEYSKLTSQFYTLIPHDFGFKNMANFILDSQQQVLDKFTMLQSLTDMKIATKIIEQTADNDFDVLEQHYKKLNCQISPLDQKSQDYQTIQSYIDNTKSGRKCTLLDVYELERDGETKRFNDLGNRLLLWHGSGIGNWGGILSQGLRIPPNGGGLFGCGLYFADMIAKSLGYTHGNNKNVACLVLADVAMGKMNEKKSFDSQSHKNLPKDKHSVKGLSSMAPPIEKYVELKGLKGVKVPAAKPEKNSSGGQIGHNEFIVYKDNQVRLKYLVKVQL